MDAGAPRRRYDASRRRAAAQDRRRAVREAARRLFLDAGYAATSVATVAEAVGVSEDLVFQVYGSKRGLLKEVIDVAIAGDDEDVPTLERPAAEELRALTDQREQLRLFAIDVTARLERTRALNDLLRSAAVVEPELAELERDLHHRQRGTSMRTVAGWIAQNGDFRDGQSVERAAALMWTLGSPEVHRSLRVEAGWTVERYRAWLADTLQASLLR